LKKGERILSLTGAEALFADSGTMTRYVTGFAFDDGYIIVDKEGVRLYTDRRYLEAAQARFADAKIRVVEIDKQTSVESLLSAYKTVALPMEETRATRYISLQKAGVQMVDATSAFSFVAAIKTDDEIARIRKACEIAEESFLSLLPTIKEGQTEREIAATLEHFMRQKGADGTSFDTIVAFGNHAAVPHHETGDRRLRFGDEILIDFGCKVAGYCSDMTRTFLFGDDGTKEDFKKAYAAVLAAHEKVLKDGKAGMQAAEIDALARDYLCSAGYGAYFTHSLGHGIGLKIHEFPLVTKGKTDEIKDGMVFSDEPGVYVEGEYGIRIEDTVLVKDGRLQSLMTTKKDLIVL